MGEESPQLPFPCNGVLWEYSGLEGLPRASGGQAPRLRSLLGLAFALLHIIQQPPFLGVVIGSQPLIYQLLLAL